MEPMEVKKKLLEVFELLIDAKDTAEVVYCPPHVLEWTTETSDGLAGVRRMKWRLHLSLESDSFEMHVPF